MDTRIIPICHRKLVTVVNSLTFIVFTTECLGMELSLSTAQPYLPTSLGESHRLLHNTSLPQGESPSTAQHLPQGESLSTAQPYLPTSLRESLLCTVHSLHGFSDPFLEQGWQQDNHVSWVTLPRTLRTTCFNLTHSQSAFIIIQDCDTGCDTGLVLWSLTV